MPLAHSRSQVSPGTAPPSAELPAPHKGWLCSRLLPRTLPKGTGLDTLKRGQHPRAKAVLGRMSGMSVRGPPLSLCPAPGSMDRPSTDPGGYSGLSLPGTGRIQEAKEARRDQCPALCPRTPCAVFPTAPIFRKVLQEPPGHRWIFLPGTRCGACFYFSPLSELL